MVRKLFRTPPDIPEDEVCRGLVLPSSKEWLGVFSDALSRTIYPYNYEQVEETDLTPDEAAAEAYTRYTAWLDATCEGGDCPAQVLQLPDETTVRVHRQNPETGRFEVLEPDGTWIEPTGDAAIPEPEARTEDTSAERICAAACNALETVKQVYQGVLDDIENELTNDQIEVSLYTAIGLAIAAALAPPVAAGIAVDLAAFWAFTEVGQAIVFPDLWNEFFEDQFRCCLVSNATDTDGVVTFDMQAVNRCLLESIGAGQYVFLVGQVTYLNYIIGSQGLSLAGALDIVETPDCTSCGQWYRVFDFRYGTKGWTATDVGDRATWIPSSEGGHWASTYAGGGTGLILRCTPPIITGWSITRIKIETAYTNSGGSPFLGVANTSQLSVTDSPTSQWLIQDSGFTLDTGAGYRIYFYNFLGGNYPCYLRRVWLWGTGTMPFSSYQGASDEGF